MKLNANNVLSKVEAVVYFTLIFGAGVMFGAWVF